MLTVDFSLMATQVTVMKTTNKTAMIRAYHKNPTRSLFPPMACTIIMVKIVTSAEPTPAQERAKVVSPSLSFPLLVNAGIMDQ